MDRFDDIAREKLPCSCKNESWKNKCADGCTSWRRPAVAQALRDAYAEGVKDEDARWKKTFGGHVYITNDDYTRLREGAKRARQDEHDRLAGILRKHMGCREMHSYCRHDPLNGCRFDMLRDLVEIHAVLAAKEEEEPS